MALKDILLYADASTRGLSRLRVASEIARHQGCRLTVLYVKDLTPLQAARRRVAELGLVPAGEMQKLDESFSEANDKAASQVRAALEALRSEYPFEAEWRCVAGTAAAVVVQYARAADLCILSQEGGTDDTLSFAEEMLFATGRPVLFVPAEGEFQTAGHNIVIAWNGSRPAARALKDALPLLAHADRVTLLSINPHEFLSKRGALSVEEILSHLRRHDVAAEAQVFETDEPIAAALQGAAHAIGADLLVAGAYGHPRLWERMIGGVTRDLLEQMTLPIMMSH